MTPSDHPNPESPATPDEVSTEIATEQAHVDRVYAELAKAAYRVALVEAEGLARGRTDRTGDVRDEEITGLFERDALMFSANRRRTTLETQYEGLVFGRLDLEHDVRGNGTTEREVRYVGRLGVRDDEYEPLVIDWRAPAAAPFYRSTPVEPMGVLRRRVLRCKGSDVVGVEDDLMVPEAPEDLVVVGDGALMAALTRTRGARMRDIVATIQRHQDEAIRAPAPRRHRDHRRPGHRQDRGRPAPRGVPAVLRPPPVRGRRHPGRRPLQRLHGVHRAGPALPRRGDA